MFTPTPPAAEAAAPSRSAQLWRFIVVLGLIGLAIVVVSAMGYLFVASFFLLLVLVVAVMAARLGAAVGPPAVFAPLAWLPLWGIPAVLVPMASFADDDLSESLAILFVLGGSLFTIAAAMVGALIGAVGGIGHRRRKRNAAIDEQLERNRQQPPPPPPAGFIGG